jgi:hypothetical protein
LQITDQTLELADRLRGLGLRGSISVFVGSELPYV